MISRASVSGRPQRVDLRRADEVFAAQPADGVRLEPDAAIAPAALDVGMVVFDVRDVRDRIHETHGAVEVLELEFALDGLAVFDELPAVDEQRQLLLRLLARQRADAA